MDKIIELSVRGSLYFYSSNPRENQLSQLRQFASQFYESNPDYKFMPDDEIAECFILSAKQTFGIDLKNLPITTVLVIK